MSHQSSSVGQTPASKGQTIQLSPGVQTCIMVLFFWGHKPDWPVTQQSRFARSVKEYIGKRFRVWLNPPDIVKYYNGIPLALEKAGYPHVWDEDMLGFCIAEVIQNPQEYDEMTEISMNLDKELSKEALRFIGPAMTDMYIDGRKDKVEAAWIARVGKIKENNSKRSSLDTDLGLRPKYSKSKTLPSPIVILSLKADRYLKSKDSSED